MILFFIFAASYGHNHQNDRSLLTYNIDNRQALSYFIANRVSVLASKEKLLSTPGNRQVLCYLDKYYKKS